MGDHGSVCLEVLSPRDWRFRLGGEATLEVFLPRGYPSREPPTPLLHCDWLDSRGRAEMVGRLLEMHCGAEVVFEWVEMLRAELCEAADETISQSSKSGGAADATEGNRAGDRSAMGLCGVGQPSCGMSLECNKRCGVTPEDASSAVATALGQASISGSSHGLAGQASLSGSGDGLAGIGVDAAADGSAAGDCASSFHFEPATSGFGQRVRHFGPEAMSPENAVQVVHGEPFTPPGKSVPLAWSDHAQDTHLKAMETDKAGLLLF
jgi:hypothetical protein